MTDQDDPGLRAARTVRGWSQTDAARELAALGRARGVPVAGPASLKTLLSRWENGHVLPEPHYRTLLGELYGRTAVQLGLAGPGGSTPVPGDLPAALAAAAAAHRSGLELWWRQLALAHELDDELGAAGAGELVRAQVDQLDDTLLHSTSAAGRIEVAAVLGGAANLAGAQALDRRRHARSWRYYDRARTAARQAGRPAAVAVAVAGQVAVLVDVGEVDAAVALLEEAPPADDGAGVRWHAAMAVARAAAGDRPATRRALDTAEQCWRAPPIDRAFAQDGPGVELTDLDRWHGRALVALGDTDTVIEAVAPLRRALAAHPRSARRRAAVHADLALALEAESPQEAAGHARAARALAGRIGSERIPARLSGSGSRVAGGPP